MRVRVAETDALGAAPLPAWLGVAESPADVDAVDEIGGATGAEDDVLGAEDGVVGADEGELLVGAPVGVLDAGADDGGAAIPPCIVTRIPPGWKVIWATHCPLGAAEVAVAVTVRLCPGASVPER